MPVRHCNFKMTGQPCANLVNGIIIYENGMIFSPNISNMGIVLKLIIVLLIIFEL